MKKHILLFLLSLGFLQFVKAQYPAIEWYYDVNDMSFGQSAMADIDNDGKPEIVFGTYRNDGQIHALNAEDGSVLWVYNTGGCMDVAPVIYDVDNDGQLEVIAPGSCVAKTFCIDGLTGALEWQAPTRGSDSPPTIADIDGDDKPEILHGEFTGYVICLNGEDGSQAWEIQVDTNCWIQTAPAITDLDNDGNLDFVVASWQFSGYHKIFAYRAHDQFKLWEKDYPTDWTYHGAAVADLDSDGLPELTIGSRDGFVYCLNGEDGSLKWSYTLPNMTYHHSASPTSIGDMDNDNHYEVIFFDYGNVGCLSHDGSLQWSYSFGGYASSFRGGALSDINGDDTLDIVFGLSDGRLMALSGGGNFLWSIDLESHYGSNFRIDHGPVISDFDADGILEAFVVGGDTDDTISYNYGRGYAISCGPGNGPDWTMFRKDILRNALVWETSTDIQEPQIEEEWAFMAYPIPSIEVPVFHFDEKYMGDIEINIYSIKGNLIHSESFHKTEKSQDYQIKMKDLSPGVYLAQAKGKEFQVIEKFIIGKP